MKRLAYFLLTLAMAATMLTGCGSQNEKEENTVEKVESRAEKKGKGRTCLLGKSDAGQL